MKRSLYILGVFIVFLQACTSKKKVVQSSIEPSVFLEDVEISTEVSPKVYHPSETQDWDLLHTKLELSFDYQKQHVIGKAYLTLKPYFYNQKTLKLDAVGFDLRAVQMNGKELEYSYDSTELVINLPKAFSASEQIEIFVDYTAKPNTLPQGGSKAITSDKGLYFINPTGKVKGKPIQIWTQGETESNSKWFVTLDAPNQKMTQEIYVTVDTAYASLSNGLLVSSTNNGDGTRTDYWKQDKAHSVYLAMLAIGDFAIVKDTWNTKAGKKIDVDYYVEHSHEKYAQGIFGNTPEMLSFYSEVLGVEYPWEKYHQVIVRDFVSGAMENTTAVIHGEFVQQTKREMLDKNYEFIVAHELFHHWFGDLVTCESWANLPLNESFATYGEYLWEQYKYGQDAADYKFQEDLRGYLSESNTKQEPLIRYHYHDKEDMFDRHSYEKGGCILHMLRTIVGDQAFFKALKVYLNDRAYKSAEIHHLRQAFEEVTGQDMHWFFDQWFMHSGHPILNISYAYDSLSNTQYIYTAQEYSNQEKEGALIYRLPFDVDVYTDDQKTSKKLVVENQRDTFSFKLDAEPELIVFDAKNILVGKKRETKPIEAWAKQYEKTTSYLSRSNALIRAYLTMSEDTALFEQLTFKALDDNFWANRNLALSFVAKVYAQDSSKYANKIKNIAAQDAKSSNRAQALNLFYSMFDHNDDVNFYKTFMKDSSYAVNASALSIVSEIDSAHALELAQGLESEKNKSIKSEVASIYALFGQQEKHDFFRSFISNSSRYTKANAMNQYAAYLMHERVYPQGFNEGVDVFESVVQSSADNNKVKLYAITALMNLKEKSKDHQEHLEYVSTAIDRLKTQVKEEELLLYLNDETSK